jgi:hypothetical protein
MVTQTRYVSYVRDQVGAIPTLDKEATAAAQTALDAEYQTALEGWSVAKAGPKPSRSTAREVTKLVEGRKGGGFEYGVIAQEDMTVKGKEHSVVEGPQGLSKRYQEDIAIQGAAIKALLARIETLEKAAGVKV